MRLAGQRFSRSHVMSPWPGGAMVVVYASSPGPNRRPRDAFASDQWGALMVPIRDAPVSHTEQQLSTPGLYVGRRRPHLARLRPGSGRARRRRPAGPRGMRACRARRMTRGSAFREKVAKDRRISGVDPRGPTRGVSPCRSEGTAMRPRSVAERSTSWLVAGWQPAVLPGAGEGPLALSCASPWATCVGWSTSPSPSSAPGPSPACNGPTVVTKTKRPVVAPMASAHVTRPRPQADLHCPTGVLAPRRLQTTVQLIQSAAVKPRRPAGLIERAHRAGSFKVT